MLAAGTLPIDSVETENVATPCNFYQQFLNLTQGLRPLTIPSPEPLLLPPLVGAPCPQLSAEYVPYTGILTWTSYSFDFNSKPNSCLWTLGRAKPPKGVCLLLATWKLSSLMPQTDSCLLG